MKEVMMQVRLDEETYIRYKLFCVKNKLSVPKQTKQIINSFLDIQDETQKLIDSCKQFAN